MRSISSGGPERWEALGLVTVKWVPPLPSLLTGTPTFEIWQKTDHQHWDGGTPSQGRTLWHLEWVFITVQGQALQVRAGTVSRNTEHMTRRVGARGIFYMVWTSFTITSGDVISNKKPWSVLECGFLLEVRKVWRSNLVTEMRVSLS